MHEVGAEADRFAPIVVDDELAAMRRSNFERFRDLSFDRLRRRFLNAQLDKSCAFAREPRNPGGVRKDGIERIEQARAQETRSSLKNGVPGPGGAGMSRGSIGPVSQPSRPASAAPAKASAIFTGAPALATAVFSRTASLPSSIASAACDGAPMPALMINVVSGK